MVVRAFAVVLLLSMPISALAETPPPFVAGFDRFARHTDISPEVGGRLLLTELNCTACHADKRTELAPKQGPRLEGAGDRLRRAWVRNYLANPHAVQPETTMPDVLVGLSREEKADTIDALDAFLANQHEAFPEIKASGLTPLPFQFWDRGSPTQGRELYHQIGCVACHAPDPNYEETPNQKSELDKFIETLDPEELKEMGLAGRARSVRSVPHGDLSKKYTLRGLTFFLLEPEKIRPGGRMPNLKLAPMEAASLAAYLLRDQRPEKVSGMLKGGRIERGRRRFNELRCANCHSAKGAEPTFATPLAKLEIDAKSSCIGATTRNLPRYPLDESQRKALRAALATLDKRSDDAGERVTFRMLQLNCFACHQRDKLGGVGRNRRGFFETVGHVDIGDEGRIPPALTNVGAKLRQPWLKKVLAGTGEVRPPMIARMPKFGASSVSDLPKLFARADGAKQPTEQAVFGKSAKFAGDGRALMEVGCVQCHPIRGEHLPGVVGIDLGNVVERIHPKWLHDFLANPASLKPGTRMPTFFSNGESSVKTILDGNVEKQIAAMYAYLKNIDKQPLPEKVLQGKTHNFVLVPKDRPILLRTFMEEAGPAAIAVGFSEKVHFAFDAEQVRFALAWRGEFLDAHGTWFNRFTPPAKPLGTHLQRLPRGMPFASLRDKNDPWPTAKAEELGYRFRGYRLDKAGVPTFLYRFDVYDIEDRIAPGPEQTLHRRVRILDREKRGPTTLWFRANVGKTMQSDNSLSFTNEAGFRATISHRGTVRKADGFAEAILCLDMDGATTLEVDYAWSVGQ